PFAKRVVAEQSEMIAEALFDFEYSCLVNGSARGSVLIVLHDKRIHKASEGTDGIGCAGGAGEPFHATERIGPAGRRVPVPVGKSLAICQCHRTFGSRAQIGVNSGGEADGM